MPTSRGAGVAKKGFDYAIYKKGGTTKKYAEGGEIEDRETKRPMSTSEMLPTRKRRMEMRKKVTPPPKRPSDTDVMKGIVREMQDEERVRKAEMPSDLYAKGGGVKKYAKGGSCRGMGAAVKGGKYSIK